MPEMPQSRSVSLWSPFDGRVRVLVGALAKPLRVSVSGAVFYLYGESYGGS